MKVTLYSKNNCPACETMKKNFIKEGKVFTEVKLGVDISVQDFLKIYPLIRSVPYVVVE